VVASEVAVALEKNKKIWPFDDCVVRTMICDHRLNMLFLFLEWPTCSVYSGEDPVTAQFHFFAVLFISSLFLHFSASLRLLTVFRRNLFVNHVFVVGD
jgi:hypothetical protein